MDASSDRSEVVLSVIVPVRNEGQSLRQNLSDCVQAIDDQGVEIVVVDNLSIDGCCHGLPPHVLIVRTEREEPREKLWRLGGSLATGQSLLWLPRPLLHAPDQFRKLVLVARELGPTEHAFSSNQSLRRRRFAELCDVPNLIMRTTKAQLDRWRRVPVLGYLLGWAACRMLRLVSAISSAAAPIETVDGCSKFGLEQIGRAPDLKSSYQERPTDRGRTKLLSVIITAHNEGPEVRRTVESVRANTRCEHEIIVVDDGSNDGSCEGLEALGVRVIRQLARIGVACSRDAGAKAALGDVFAFLDAHQRVPPGCLDRSALLSALHGAITCPPCRPLGRRYAVSYGASFRLCPKRGFFSARYRLVRPRQEVTRISGLRSPGYVIPRTAFDRVGWISGLRGWGATDYAVALKAFFTDVLVLHINTDAVEHLFRKTSHYETNWQGVWRNHALIARVCFDDRTWTRYWLPAVFQANMTPDALEEMDSQTVLAEHERFMALKVRPDREFWRGLLRIHEPDALRH